MISSVKQITKTSLLSGLLWLSVVPFVLLINTTQAQNVSITLRADSTHIFIGDPLKVRLSIKHPLNSPLALPVITDTLGNLEVISVDKPDTLIAGDSRTLSQVYTVSAYDSGQFHAGPYGIIYTAATGGTDTVFSNAILVSVNTLDVDTAKPFKEIKGPLQVPYSWREFIPHIIAAVVLLFLIIAGILWYRRYKKNKPAVIERPKPKDPAHVWARKELQKLETDKVWQKDEVKLYYSRLTDILRLYLEFRYDWFALESTTEEIQEQIEKYNLKDKAKEQLLSTLRTADLVKFAKMLPAPDANIKAMENAYKFIEFTEAKEEIGTNKTIRTKVTKGGLKNKKGK